MNTDINQDNIKKKTKSMLLGYLNSSGVENRTLGRQTKQVHIKLPILGMHGQEGWRACGYDPGSLLEL